MRVEPLTQEEVDAFNKDVAENYQAYRKRAMLLITSALEHLIQDRPFEATVDISKAVHHAKKANEWRAYPQP